MEKGKILRGFTRLDFIDEYKNECSLQESSLASKKCIWLGVNEHRMHLDVGMVKALLPFLHQFVDGEDLEVEFVYDGPSRDKN